jgi:hypothetical protein
MVAVGSKIVTGHDRNMIGTGALEAMVAGKVDIVNAGDEITHSQGFLFKIGFHGLMLTSKLSGDFICGLCGNPTRASALKISDGKPFPK